MATDAAVDYDRIVRETKEAVLSHCKEDWPLVKNSVRPTCIARSRYTCCEMDRHTYRTFVKRMYHWRTQFVATNSLPLYQYTCSCTYKYGICSHSKIPLPTHLKITSSILTTNHATTLAKCNHVATV